MDENDSDCRIIAEILVFKEKHPNDEVYFITSDNRPYLQADALGINTFFWTDDEYKEIFEPIKPKSKKEEKLTDLKIYFENKENEYKISTETKLKNLEDFVKEEFPNYSYLVDIEKKKSLPLENAKNHEISKNLTIKEAEEKGFPIGNIFKSLEPILKIANMVPNIHIKSNDEFKEDILQFYEEMKEYRKYNRIKFFLINNGSKPYNNVNIQLYTILEKNFEIKSKEDLEKPIKPKIERYPFSSPSLAFLSVKSYKEYNVKYSVPEKIEKEKNDIWTFGYSIKKIQHNVSLPLYPIMIKFPEGFKMKKITFFCTFTHDEEGITMEQKLKLDIVN